MMGLYRLVKNRPYVLLVATIAIVVSYLVSIWILGTVAAAFVSILFLVQGKNISVAAYATRPWEVAWSWTFGMPEHPEVRVVWLVLVGTLATAGLIRRHQVRDFWERWRPNERADMNIETLKIQPVKYGVRQELVRTPTDQVFLAMTGKRKPVYVPVPHLREHVHILGGSGSGKTSMAIIPICVQLVRKDMGLIAIDFKGDKQAIQVLAQEAALREKKFFFFSLHPEIGSNTWNPLLSGTSLSKVEKIMVALQLMFEGEARFYSYAQQAVFLPLLRHFDSEGARYSLRDIVDVLGQPKLVERITREKMSPGQIKGLTSALTAFTDFSRINVYEPDIDLGQIIKNGDVVYFDLRSALAPEMSSSIGKMIAMDIQYHSAFRTEHDSMVAVVIDEFQNMACPAFKNIISKVRSANLSLVLANQAMGDLRAVSDDFLNTVITNTRTKIVFGIEDPADAEFFAKRSGQVLVKAESYSDQYSSDRSSNSFSIQEKEKYRIHPNVILKMPFGTSIIFRRSELAELGHHSHYLSLEEKKRLELEAWPLPAETQKLGVSTVRELIVRLKDEMAEEEKEKKKKKKSNAGKQPTDAELAALEWEEVEV